MKQIIYTLMTIFILFSFLGLTFSQDIIISTTWWCLTWVWNGCLVLDPENKFTAMSIAQDLIFAATYMIWTNNLLLNRIYICSRMTKRCK